MKLKLILASLAFTCLMTPQLAAQNNDWVDFKRYSECNKTIAGHPKAVLLGDSITDSWASQRNGFFKENNFVGRGISGQTSSQILLRFRKDVLAHHPKYVAILCGVNDIALNNYYVSLEDTFNNIVSMCDIAKANKIKPILCTTTPAAKILWRPEVTDSKEQILEFNQMLRDYAKANKIKLVDYAAALQNEEGSTSLKYSGDGVHPNEEGYKIMEELLLKAIQ